MFEKFPCATDKDRTSVGEVVQFGQDFQELCELCFHKAGAVYFAKTATNKQFIELARCEQRAVDICRFAYENRLFKLIDVELSRMNQVVMFKHSLTRVELPAIYYLLALQNDWPSATVRTNSQ